MRIRSQLAAPLCGGSRSRLIPTGCSQRTSVGAAPSKPRRPTFSVSRLKQRKEDERVVRDRPAHLSHSELGHHPDPPRSAPCGVPFVTTATWVILVAVVVTWGQERVESLVPEAGQAQVIPAAPPGCTAGAPPGRARTRCSPRIGSPSLCFSSRPVALDHLRNRLQRGTHGRRSGGVDGG